jgi:hypothetical protein
VEPGGPAKGPKAGLPTGGGWGVGEHPVGRGLVGVGMGVEGQARTMRCRCFEAEPAISTLIRLAERCRSIEAAKALRLSPPASGMASDTAGAQMVLGFGIIVW